MLWELKKAKRKNHIPARAWASLTNEERDRMFMEFLDYESDMYRKSNNYKKRMQRACNV